MLRSPGPFAARALLVATWSCAVAACGAGAATTSPAPVPSGMSDSAGGPGGAAAPAAAAPASGAAAGVTPPALRLPGDVAPTSYAVDLAIDPAKDHFTGAIEI